MEGKWKAKQNQKIIAKQDPVRGTSSFTNASMAQICAFIATKGWLTGNLMKNALHGRKNSPPQQRTKNEFFFPKGSNTKNPTCTTQVGLIVFFDDIIKKW